MKNDKIAYGTMVRTGMAGYVISYVLFTCYSVIMQCKGFLNGDVPAAYVMQDWARQLSHTITTLRSFASAQAEIEATDPKNPYYLGEKVIDGETNPPLKPEEPCKLDEITRIEETIEEMKNYRVSIIIEPEMKEKLEAMAEIYNTSMGGYIRRFLKFDLNRECVNRSIKIHKEAKAKAKAKEA